MKAAIKQAEELYEQFYKIVPTRVMHFNTHRELAVNIALISVRDKIKTLESICRGMMSRTCEIGSDPSEVLEFQRKVEQQLVIKQKEIKEEVGC